MTTNQKFNVKILLVWIGYAIVMLALGLFIGDALDIHPNTFKLIYGVIAFLVLTYGTLRFGKYVNKVRNYELDKEEGNIIVKR